MFLAHLNEISEVKYTTHEWISAPFSLHTSYQKLTSICHPRYGEKIQLNSDICQGKECNVFVVLVLIGQGLECYRCSTNKDWSECSKIQEKVKCAPGSDQCFKLFFDGQKGHVSDETYKKGCTTNSSCSQAEELCKKAEFGPGIKCELTWCTGDLCNAVALPTISFIIVKACVVVYFLNFIY